MTKRIGNLYDSMFTLDALYSAYLKARKGKRKALAVMRFEQNLGANLRELCDQLQSGDYKPSGYRRFFIREPKLREISAPAFRDVVVQHAIYQVINPIFDATFVHDNYGCRVEKGTHKASDAAQKFLRQSPADSYTLQLDIRKFYYRIDRGVLEKLVARKIKDQRLLELMMKFADHGEPLGVPIGSLLSQLYALIYLDAMDHFIKRELKIGKYVRYVDDFVLFGLSKEDALQAKGKIETFLSQELKLELSRWAIEPVKKGINFVGFRTWRSKRFVRKHSLYKFSKSLRLGDLPSLSSIIGNALRSSTFAHLCKRVFKERPELAQKLPFHKWRINYVY
jgi:RNA-directed DNA polymerase